MNTMFWEIGIFNIALVLMIFYQVFEDRKKYKDCMRFGRLLLACAAILVVDTLGWGIDGKPILGQVWITMVIDALDLILTSTVCWCWVQYTLYIVDEKRQEKKKWHRDFATVLLVLQIILVLSSQVLGFYFYVDEAGVYHRGSGYIVHSLISVAMLGYSSGVCSWAYRKETEQERRKELLFLALIIYLPIAGNLFQLFVYGYPTVWLCMVFMVFTVYIHIQNKRINQEWQEQNRMLKEALVQAQAANAAKTEFFSRMSHDMRTPMNGILGLANLSVEETDLKVLQDNVAKMKTVGEYMLGLINDTLDFQKIESGKMVLEPRVIQAGELLESVCSMVRETAKEKGIRFKIINKNVALEHYIRIDPLRVKQILINLLSNAIKFTPRGGNVEMVIEVLWTENKVSHDLITIKDTGIGMSREFLNNGIFKPFSQEYNSVTAKTSGTGLGLSISKQLVELMGGDISVKSEPGAGTTFWVRLDFEEVEEEIVEQSTEAYTEQKAHMERILKGKVILLAEDHPLNAELTIRLLEKMECEVVWAKNGLECVELFEASLKNHFDVILMDIRMPLMDGLEATRKIRAMDRRDARTTPIIAMTANAYEDDMRQSAEAGMNAHLAKPVDPKTMFHTIVKYIE